MLISMDELLEVYVGTSLDQACKGCVRMNKTRHAGTDTSPEESWCDDCILVWDKDCNVARMDNYDDGEVL